MAVPAPDDPRAHLRASDADRERMVDLLREHFTAGRLTLPEFEQRVSEAYDARTFGRLDEVIRDLPVPAPAPRPPGPPVRPRPQRQARLAREVTRYLVVNAFLVLLWVAGPSGVPFWPIWPILIWGLIVASRAINTLGGDDSR